jgi:magnesium transporter
MRNKWKLPQLPRRRKKVRRASAPGTAPGTITIDPEAQQPRIIVHAYSNERIENHEMPDLDAAHALVGQYPVVWINIDGLGDEVLLHRARDLFGLHPLAMEDVVNTFQRSKMEPYRNHIFLVVHLLEPTDPTSSEQVSLFLGPGYVLTFQEKPGDCFETVRQRLRRGGRIRTMGADYLAYALLDALVDHYFPILERFEDRLDALEDKAFGAQRPETLRQIQRVKQELLAIRRQVWPVREAVSGLLRDETGLITDETRIFLRDCEDHAVRVIDLLEHHRERGSQLMDLYLSSVSNQMNEIMKTLTIMATIFIPLSFIAGLYGMNFDPKASPWNMPELAWTWGYPFALGVMATVAAGLLVFFRRKGWLGGRRSRPADSPDSGESLDP